MSDPIEPAPIPVPSDLAPVPSDLALATAKLLEAKELLAKLDIGAPSGSRLPSDGTPGYKTSEFWLTALHQAAGLLAASGAIPGFTDPTLKAATLGSAIVSLIAYVVARYKYKVAP